MMKAQQEANQSIMQSMMEKMTSICFKKCAGHSVSSLWIEGEVEVGIIAGTGWSSAAWDGISPFHWICRFLLLSQIEDQSHDMVHRPPAFQDILIYVLFILAHHTFFYFLNSHVTKYDMWNVWKIWNILCYQGNKLDSSEQRCMAQCQDRYLDVRQQVQEALQKRQGWGFKC